ncbi:MAG: ABC transporter substrate-binding protein [Oscillospiraceae bacterium]|nr:ABC transporter substrate-binding protein [Oscillospiraceae bacterium]
MLLGMAACATTGGDQADAGQKKDKFVIGVCQFMPHPALDKATEGFLAAVKAGLGEENVTFDVQDAAGEASNCATIVNGLVSSNVDLIMANATPALAAAYNATETIPILGTSVTEYGVALGIENFSGTVGGNVSGTSDLADLALQADMVTKWCPNAKKVGLLFCSAEANSKYQVNEVQKALEGKGITCKQFAFADTSDLMAVTKEAADFADAIYVPTDNTVANNATAIDSVCRPAKVPIIAGEAGICGGCGIATMSIDYYDLGYKTGEMAVDILKNGADITKMKIEYTPAEKVSYLYNEEICKELGIAPLEGYDKLPAAE